MYDLDQSQQSSEFDLVLCKEIILFVIEVGLLSA